MSNADKIALLEFLCNEFMTKSVAFRKYLDENSNKLEELRKEKWQETLADRQAKKKGKEESDKPAPVEEPDAADAVFDRKAAAVRAWSTASVGVCGQYAECGVQKKRKAEQEAAREQRRLAEEVRREEKKVRARMPVCWGLTRHTERAAARADERAPRPTSCQRVRRPRQKPVRTPACRCCGPDATCNSPVPGGATGCSTSVRSTGACSSRTPWRAPGPPTRRPRRYDTGGVAPASALLITYRAVRGAPQVAQ